MADKLWNEVEEYLLQRWKDAGSMEEQMGKVRDKYKGLCQRIADEVRDKHKELDVGKVWVTQFWGTGYIGVGKSAWPAKGDEYSGFWISNLRLEVLADDSERATGCVWIAGKIASDDISAAKKRVRESASRILSKAEKWNNKDYPGDDGTALWFQLPESNQDLLKMLADGDGQHFVDCLVGHLESLIRFSPVLDEVFLKSEK